MRALTGRVSGSISTLVVTVQSDIQTEVLGHVLIFAVTKHIRVVT